MNQGGVRVGGGVSGILEMKGWARVFSSKGVQAGNSQTSIISADHIPLVAVQSQGISSNYADERPQCNTGEAWIRPGGRQRALVDVLGPSSCMKLRRYTL